MTGSLVSGHSELLKAENVLEWVQRIKSIRSSARKLPIFTISIYLPPSL